MQKQTLGGLAQLRLSVAREDEIVEGRARSDEFHAARQRQAAARAEARGNVFYGRLALVDGFAEPHVRGDFRRGGRLDRMSRGEE